ncbi:hypothetical protein M405DRAFT_813210 [Rhizopogon salebrosus TDB-379]|nr:hypothetical protein M405DRAFT_813210 [Rhizopogon salebrosus TDB-379]
MAHLSSDSKSPMYSLSPFSNSLPPNISGPSPQRMNHYPLGLHVKWSTPLTHIRVIPAREPEPAPDEPDIPQHSKSSQHNDTRTIAHAMKDLELTPHLPASGAGTKSLQVTHQPTLALQLEGSSQPSESNSQLISTPQSSQSHPYHVAASNPNLRFILAAHSHQAIKFQQTPNASHGRLGSPSVDIMTGELAFSTCDILF